MDNHIHHRVHIRTLHLCFFLISLPLLECKLQDNKYFECGSDYRCGSRVLNNPYPFWGSNRPYYCGAGDQFALYCNSSSLDISIQIDSQSFTVVGIDMDAETITLRALSPYDSCSPNLATNPNFHSTAFRYKENVQNITVFYDCPSSAVSFAGNNFTCQVNGSENLNVFYAAVNQTLFQHFPLLEKCGTRIQVPLSLSPPKPNIIYTNPLYGDLERGFDAYYFDANYQNCRICKESGGTCGSNETNSFSCHCSDGTHHALSCSFSHKSQLGFKRRIIIGVASALMGGFIICIIICCCKCMSSTRQVKFWLTRKNDQNIEAFLKKHAALAQRRYRFSQVKKMTNSFKVKLGQGGFGAVYKGELVNGCPVAVKILKESKGNGEEFINEVASIGRTSHVNVVTLLGFCLEGNKKALIYEFMANGSLDKFIHNKKLEVTPSLSWDNLWQIAVGIARGLEYLHRGCNTRILHFDIKPHNILLDETFCPKISDFGLAKLCPRKDSIISMSDARGTFGYVAPEVWNRHFGGVSHKSDVYSYGMMLLEMVGGTKNTNAEASHTSEMYFPDWIYNRLEQGSDLRPDGVMDIGENEIVRRMTLVGLWCIQTLPNDRPTMSRVVDMLEGNINSLEMPPKPILSSPTTISISESPSN